MKKIRLTKNSLKSIGLFILFLICYRVLVIVIKSNNFLPFDWEHHIILSINALRTPMLTSLMRLVTNSVEYFVAIPLFCTAIFLYKQKQKTKIVLLLTFATVGSFIGMMLKFELNRPRLSFIDVLVYEISASFPSGHTIIALCTYGIIASILYDYNYKALSLCCIIWCLLVAFSRVYLGAHYITDILGAFAYGGMVLVLYISSNKMLMTNMEMK